MPVSSVLRRYTAIHTIRYIVVIYLFFFLIQTTYERDLGLDFPYSRILSSLSILEVVVAHRLDSPRWDDYIKVIFISALWQKQRGLRPTQLTISRKLGSKQKTRCFNRFPLYILICGKKHEAYVLNIISIYNIMHFDSSRSAGALACNTTYRCNSLQKMKKKTFFIKSFRQ